MLKFLCGIIIGIIVSSIGFSGLAHVADNGVNKIKSVSQSANKQLGE